MQDMAATNGIASHEGNDRFWHRADQPLQFKDIETRHTILADVTALLLAADLLVTP